MSYKSHWHQLILLTSCVCYCHEHLLCYSQPKKGYIWDYEVQLIDYLHSLVLPGTNDNEPNIIVLEVVKAAYFIIMLLVDISLQRLLFTFVFIIIITISMSMSSSKCLSALPKEYKIISIGLVHFIQRLI